MLFIICSKICKIRVSSLVGKAISIIILLLEMLIWAEFAKESKQYMKRLNYRFLILQLVHWNITHSTNDLRVVLNVHVDFRAWERRCFERLFHLRGPFLHKWFNIGHILCVINSGRRTSFMKILNRADPSRNFARLFVSVIDWVNIHWSSARHIFALDILEF